MKATGLTLCLMLSVLSCGLAGESLVTVRVGEQDTCDVTGVTTLDWDAKAARSRIRFDLAKLPAATEVRRALLCFWVPAASPFDRAYKTWGAPRWDEPGFDGFKVWDGDALLDVRYPFNAPTFWRYEFDVTDAVRRWVRDPASNRGLTTSFQFPVAIDNSAGTAWQRPYLQVTHVGANPDRPKPPRDLKARFRSGQVFLTWQQVPHAGAFFDSTYRVYRGVEPITAANLGQAEFLGEVHRLSQLNYRRVLTARGGDYGPWKYYVSAAGEEPYRKGESRDDRMARVLPLIPERFNFVTDDAWPQAIDGGKFLTEPTASERMQIHQGPQLPDDMGLFVHTVREAGPAYFAVTSVLEGNENRAEPATTGPVAVKVEEPKPVLQAVFTANGPEGYQKIGKFQVREYVYWEGGGNRFHPEPSTPFCFTFHVPRRWVNLGYAPNADKQFPPWICSLAKVAGYSISYWDGRGIVMDTGYMPPTRLAPFPPGGAQNMRWAQWSRFYYGSRTPPAAPVTGPSQALRDVYGYTETLNTGADPRKATVRPYFENRRLFELDFVLKSFPADPNFVWASGEGSTLNFAIHHADRIGCVEGAQERPWTSPRGAEGKDCLVGRREWGLKNELGHDVWEWNDAVWLAKQFPERAWPYVSNCHSDNYDGADNWTALGFPKFYLDLARAKQGGEWWWCDIGDAPNGKFQRVPRNMAYPVLSRVTCCQTPATNWRDEPRGTLNGYVVWHRPTMPWLYVRDLAKEKNPPPAPPDRPIPYAVRPYGGTIRWGAVPLDLVDTPERFEVALRIGDDGLMLNGQSVPPCRVVCGAADVTPRRLQRLQVETGKRYLWRNVRVATGQLLQAGAIQPDEHGLLTVPQFLVDRDICGNKLILEALEGKQVPVVDRAQKVAITWFRTQADRHHDRNAQTEELPYDGYVKRCLAPELVPVVRPDKVFRIDDFVNARGFREGGLYSQWGGGFDDAYEFPEAGRYRIEVETTKALFQNGAWPILGLSVDSRPVGERLLDSEQTITRTWWVDLSKGRHTVRFWLMNNVFNEPVPRNGDQSPKPDRGFSLVGVRFVHLEERPETVTKVHEVEVTPRSTVTCAGLPVRLRADVRGPWGETPMPRRPEWTATGGATITPDGVFSAPKPGAYTVKATVGGKSDSVTVRVQGGVWVDDFDDEWPDGWVAAPPAPDAKEKPQWMVTRHHGFIGVLAQRNLRAPGPHLILYEGGSACRDVSVRVDVLREGEGIPRGSAQGIVFGCRDGRNHYRFERHEGKEGATFRLVKVVNGKEEELASVARAVAPLRVARSEYPSCRLWSEGRRQDPKPVEFDRFQVELHRGRIVANFNGQEVLTVEDKTFEAGTVGLWCLGGAAFDNVVVQPLR